MRKLLETSKCHTLDRNDLRAQRDSCGLGLTDEWKLAVTLQFNVTHWPYIQSSQNYDCVGKFFSDSVINLSVDSAIQLASAVSMLLLTTIM
jgi:hypothetical protein